MKKFPHVKQKVSPVLVYVVPQHALATARGGGGEVVRIPQLGGEVTRIPE